MAKTKQIVDLCIKSHIIVEGGIDQQAEILNLVTRAHQTGDYSTVLARATIDSVKAETKKRRFEETAASAAGAEPATEDHPADADAATDAVASDEDPTPAFMRPGHRSASTDA